MRNKYFSSFHKAQRTTDMAVSQQLYLSRVPTRNVMSANTNYSEKQPLSPQPPLSHIQIKNSNPQGCECCVKRSTTSHRKHIRPQSSYLELNPSVIAIEWDGLVRGNKSQRGSSIHSNPYLLLLEGTDRSRRKHADRKGIGASCNTSHVVNYMPNKVVAQAVPNRMSPSRSKHYNRMFQLHSHPLPKNIFSCPLDGSYNILHSRPS